VVRINTAGKLDIKQKITFLPKGWQESGSCAQLEASFEDGFWDGTGFRL